MCPEEHTVSEAGYLQGFCSIGRAISYRPSGDNPRASSAATTNGERRRGRGELWPAAIRASERHTRVVSGLPVSGARRMAFPFGVCV